MKPIPMFRWILVGSSGMLMSLVVPLLMVVLIIGSIQQMIVAPFEQAWNAITNPPVPQCPLCENVEDHGQRPTALTQNEMIAQAAMLLQDRLSGPRATIYDPNDPVVRPVYAYWVDLCGGTVCEVIQSGNLQCVQFVLGAFHLANLDLPVQGNGVDFWHLYHGRAGWQRISVADVPQEQRGLPAVGDIMVWSGETYGHVAIVIDVQPPPDQVTPGTVTVAQANAAGNRWGGSEQSRAGNWYTMWLWPDLSVETWPGYQVLGYLRWSGPGSGSA